MDDKKKVSKMWDSLLGAGDDGAWITGLFSKRSLKVKGGWADRQGEVVHLLERILSNKD